MVTTIGNVPLSTMVKIVKKALKKNLMPVLVNDKKWLPVIMCPKAHYSLMVLLARSAYKHNQWVKRYNIYRASKNKPLYRETKAELRIKW